MYDSKLKPSRKLVLVEMNEINFDLVVMYVAKFPGKFKSFEACLEKLLVTSSELEYQNLEPWIQWPSVHTGKNFDEHQVFRLGDIVQSNQPQIFEELENHGFSVGALSAMNASNKLRQAAYFLPDPWTNTEPDNSFWSRAISAAVSQAVNDNASGQLTIRSIVALALALSRFARPSHYSKYIQLALSARGHPWRKALFLDLFLHDVHYKLFKSKCPDFSTLFLNAGAHIQHHYLFNSLATEKSMHLKNPEWYVAKECDPFHEMLEVYDLILREVGSLGDTELIVATGLSQMPYDRLKFYYRLRNHEQFLRTLDIPFKAVLTRMTRDFLIEFESAKQASSAENTLRSITVFGEGERLFDNIDNRGDSLFVTMTYPSEITRKTKYVLGGVARDLQSEVVFVAIKNGIHQAKGFAYYTDGLERFMPEDGAHIKEINKTIKKYFGLQTGLT